MFSYKKKNSTNKSVEIFCEHPITLIKKLKSNEFCFFFTLGSSQLSTLPPAAPPTMSTDLISLRYELKVDVPSLHICKCYLFTISLNNAIFQRP